ncbi:hypothetical protein FNV43_RR16965 [Rhamnella rubrinervis]|uniref:Leucine-rich repeat-containing N-terminal plant-type domain-containing protein n=1 Tax=Rhamnella rubrinervis TaxID=2594499 RepID=A0A8K0MCW6_9ROSA|nr:hypothetical protein FNV43_RR16965 [Rhamnella rubrinervis]
MKFWMAKKDCCSWDGVTCSVVTGHVLRLDINCGWLHGLLHSNSSLFKLRQLQRLNFAFNNFTLSSIPSQLSQLYRLTHLDLSLPSVSGNIPPEISWLTKFPKNFFHLPEIRDLDVSLNDDLVGTLPSTLWNLSELNVLDLSDNNFSGNH